VLYLK